ncbi:hypothetical protein KKG58_02765 [Patescibacteria group bacterium]|nr:hypothetical protein [Patescibacteria group bacterium]
MSKKTKQKREKHNSLIWIILLIIIIFLIFLYQQRNEEINIEEIEPLEEINLSQFKVATFSDSFSSDAWIDVDKTTLILDQEQRSFVFPISEQDIAGSLSDDSKIKTGPRQAVSKKFNFNVKEIKACRIDKLEKLEINSKIRYFLTNNQGIDWIETEIGQIVYFENTGNDLRWRVIISPLERTGQETENSSKINSINLTYWYER